MVTKGTAALGWLDPAVKMPFVCAHSFAHSFAPLQAALSSGQDPQGEILPYPRAAAWEGGPQEELQHSHSTRHSLPINN